MNERIKVPFTNNIGQTIEVGDDVVVVTMCTNSVYTYRGKYLGLKNGRVQAQVLLQRRVLVDKETREEVDPNIVWKILRSEGILFPDASPWLKYDSAEYREALERYRNRQNEILSKCEYEARRYTRITTLQKDRIYKLAA